MAGICSGLGAYGRHIGVASSYGAFIAPLGHIAARLHAIGGQSRHAIAPDPYRPMILVAAHAGLKTGEDGPTHADPQALQLFQENFPRGTAITLTPWDPAEMWPLVSATLARRPAVIVPFVTRPNETVPDRETLGLAPAAACSYRRLSAARAARQGRRDDRAPGERGGDVVRQRDPAASRQGGRGPARLLRRPAPSCSISCPRRSRRRSSPRPMRRRRWASPGSRCPTMYRWVRSDRGRAATLHPFMKGHFLGSGQAEYVLAEAGLDGEGLYKGVRKFLEQTAPGQPVRR